MSEPSLPSLSVLAVGLGQAGGNLAAAWAEAGHAALYINTARSDLRGLVRQQRGQLHEDQTLYVGLRDVDGAGRDPAYGKACVAEHAERIRETVAKVGEGHDALLLCAGLGGGTGSALGALVDALLPLDIPLLTLTTLPAESESGVIKVNAIRALDELVEAEVHGRFFLDNARATERFKDTDLVSFWPRANAAALRPLADLLVLNGRADLHSLRSFDAEDLRKVLLSGGVLVAHQAILAAREPIDAEALLGAVDAAVDGGALGARGMALADCAYVALVVSGPEARLRETPAHVFDELSQRLKDETGGGAIYEGLYVSDDDEPVRISVLSSARALPDRATELLAQAQGEGERLLSKVERALPRLELRPLEGLDLFRGPVPSSSSSRGPRRPPPRPRPLREQLRASPPDAVDRDAWVPKVGTGRYDEDETGRMEVTHYEAVPDDDPSVTSQVAQPAVSSERSYEEDSLERDVDAAIPAAQWRGAQAAFEVDPDAPHFSLQSTEGKSDDELEVAGPDEPTFVGRPDGDEPLSSVNDGHHAELQGVYEDLIDRFRQAPDKRGRDRVARRLCDDARSTDVEVRALAVWAMVALDEPTFQSALNEAKGDPNPEIAKLAQQGQA